MTTSDEDEIKEILKQMEDAPDEETGAGPDVVVEEPESQEVKQESVSEPESEPEVDPDQKPPEGYVPYNAMYKERASRKEAQEELDRLRAEFNQYREQQAKELGELKVYREQLAEERKQREQDDRPKKMDLVTLPDPEEVGLKAYTDAINHNATAREHNLRLEMEAQAEAKAAAALEQHMKPINEAYTQHQQMTREQQEHGQLLNAVTAREQSFAMEQSDYYPAIDAYKQQRFEDFKALGLPPDSAMNAMQREMVTQAKQFMEANMNPAQAWYSLALRRGWKQPTVAAAQPQTEQQQSSKPARQPGKPSVETMQRGMQSSDGLANAQQSGGAMAPDPEALLNKLLDKPEHEIAAMMRDGTLDKLSKKVMQ